MSSDNPPYPYYDGIPFNPSFFTSDSGSGLTETAANALYLRKTTPDTATALETFNGGIVTPSLSSTGSLDIVMPNALASNVLNVGVVSRNISGQVHHYSDGDGCVAGANVHLNNGINNASNTNISNGTTTTGQVNIMTGASSTGTTTIGTTGTTIGINGTTTITGATTIAGTTNINTSNGLNTTIGTVTTGTTSLRGATISLNNTNIVNINTNPPSDNTKQINIGGVNGSNTTLISTYGRLTVVGTTNINTSGTANTSIGVAGSTTAILGTTNINTSGGQSTSIGNGSSTTNIVGPINLNGVGSTNTSLITIGNDTNGGITTLSSDTINIGNADTATTMNATNIKQVIKTVAGTLIENTVGNTSIASSMSSTFNTKVGASAGSPLNCYTIIANTADQFTTQYFEIIVSGSNNSRGAYTYKGCFGVEKIGTGTMTASSVSTLFYYGTGTNPPTSSAIPVIDFTLAGQTLTLRVNTSTGSTNQHFVTTLIGYPTVSITTSPILQDFIITAV